MDQAATAPDGGINDKADGGGPDIPGDAGGFADTGSVEAGSQDTGAPDTTSSVGNDGGNSGSSGPSWPPGVQIWDRATGGNGHGYLVVTVPDKITWADANAASISAGGHLVTLTSAAENQFVYSLVSPVTAAWPADSAGGEQGPWLGANETGSTWSWVTGEPWVYTNWAMGQPSGTYMGVPEDKLQMRGTAALPAPTWNDEGNAGFDTGPVAYIVEFE